MVPGGWERAASLITTCVPDFGEAVYADARDLPRHFFNPASSEEAPTLPYTSPKGHNDGQQKHATEALKKFQEPSLLRLKILITKKAAYRYAYPIIQRNTETDSL